MQYTWFMRYTLVVFLFLLPISLAGHLGYWSLPFSLIIGCAYIMLEYVGRYIETPFENQVNDVPMDYLSRTVENDLREMLGETGLPPAIKPQGLGCAAKMKSQIRSIPPKPAVVELRPGNEAGATGNLAIYG